jgi:hypothetical protein
MHALSIRLSGKRLYIADLARRMEAMESGAAPMSPLAYRLFARRMQTAMAGYPAGLLAAQLGAARPSVLQALEQRYFEAAGSLPGEPGRQAVAVADRLIRRLSMRRGEQKPRNAA